MLSFNFATASLALLALVSGSHAASVIGRADVLIECLKSSLSKEGSVLTPGQPLFANDTGRYSELYAPTFRVVSAVANEADVRASIKCASKCGTKFLVTGPRHGFYKGFEKLQDALEIYTEAFDKVTVDAKANTLTCGGAAKFQQIIDVASAAKKIIPTGSGSCVGVLGAGLGGGIGRLEGLYGLIIDNLLSVRIMLPDTTVIEASEKKHPNLFWGIRGAGANFGFVLNATFKVHDDPGLQLNADITYPANITESFFAVLKKQASKIPPALSLASATTFDPQSKMTTLTINAVYAGPESEGRKAIQFLLNQGPILKQNITVVPWNQIIPTSFYGGGSGNCVKGVTRKSISGTAFNVIDPKAFGKFTDGFNAMIAKYPQTIGSSIALYFPATQAVMAIPDDATAFPFRKALGHQILEVIYNDTTTTDETIGNIPEKLRAEFSATAGTNGLQTYIGFSHGDEPIESIYGKRKLPRLAALKKKYDPHGLFNAFHPLPTSYP